MTKFSTTKTAIAKRTSLVPAWFLLTSVVVLSVLKVVVIIIGNLGWL